MSIGEAFDDFEIVGPTKSETLAENQEELLKTVTQWNDIVETVKEIDAKLPVSLTTLQGAHNGLERSQISG